MNDSENVETDVRPSEILVDSWSGKARMLSLHQTAHGQRLDAQYYDEEQSGSHELLGFVGK